MSMSKKDFIALADVMREVYADYDNAPATSLARNSVPVNLQNVRDKLAQFCARQNPRFMRDRWLGYIAGTNGKNGGTVRAHQLVIESLHDAQANCTCGSWSIVHTGPMTRTEIQRAFRQHTLNTRR